VKTVLSRIVDKSNVAVQAVVTIAVVAVLAACGVPVFAALLVGAAVFLLLFDARSISAFYSPIFRSFRSLFSRPAETSFVSRLASAFIAVAAIWVVLNLVVNPKYGTALYSTPEVLGLLLLMITLLPAMYAVVRRTGASAGRLSINKRRLLLAITFVTIFGLMLTMGYAVLRPLGSDPMTITRTAQLLLQGETLDPSRVRYFERYPNLIFLTLIFWKIFTVAERFGISDLVELRMILVVLNAIVMSSAVFVTFLVAKRVAGAVAGVFSLILSTAFLVVSPWIGVPYSDALGTIFPIVLVYLYLRSRDGRGIRTTIICYGLIGIVSAIGYAVKPTVLFTLLAIIGVMVLRSLTQQLNWKSLRRPVIATCVSLSLFLVSHAGLGAIQNGSGTVPFDISNNEGAFPATHFLMMGAQGNGGYTGSDVKVSEAIESADDRFWNGIQVYGERVSEMGFEGYVNFLGSKALFTWGNGTFAQWAEGGSQDSPFTHTDPMSKAVQSYYDPDGINRQVLVNFWQASWLVVLLLLAVPLFFKRKQLFSDPLTIMRVAVILLTVFLLLFEARARYLYLYLPVIIVLASASFVPLFHQLDQWLRRRGAKQPVKRLR